MKNNDLENRGIKAAKKYLTNRGYEVIETEWECESGVADIIAIDPESDALVFCEVKTRESVENGFPSESNCSEKRDRCERIALSFLAENVYTDRRIRFDSISLIVMDSNRALLRHHIDAFSGGSLIE